MIAKLFEQQAGIHGGRPAIRDGSTTVSYDELNRDVDRVAGVLRRRLERQTPVAILTHRMRDAVASMLGVLRSANVCVPLDPQAPAARQSAIMDHSGARAILTSGESLGQARQAAGGRAVVLVPDRLADDVDRSSTPVEAAPEDLAFILYTSGSTGAPKGVVHDQLGILEPARYWSERFGFSCEDRFLHLSPLSHVSSVNDILKPLLCGGCMVPFRVTGSTPGGLAETVERQKITVYHSIPSVFRATARAVAERPAALASLRLVHLGGEPLFRTDVDLFRQTCPPSCVLVHNLGSTEIPGFIQEVIGPETQVDSPVIPVGFPADGKRVFLRDAEGRDVPKGEVGEIVAQSAYLARGYWNDPEATAARFGGTLERREERTFRTGDLGRQRPDGRIEFLGRADDQIKVRGHRVDLAEVLFALQEAARDTNGIHEATVAPHTTPSGATGIVGYVAAPCRDDVDLAALREHMASRLPGPMVPETVLVVDAIPKTSTGKVDRPALPTPATGRPERGPAQPVRSVVARQLQALWEQLLRVEDIDPSDDFFELGADSLLALELSDEVERVFGRALSLPEIAEASTLESMARVLESGARRQPFPCLVPFKAEGTKSPLFLVHGLGGGVLEMRRLARTLDAERPVYALQARGVDGVSRPCRSIAEMASHYLEELSRVRPDGPCVLGGFSMGGVVAYEMAQRLLAAGRTVDELVLIDAGAPLPLPWRERITGSIDYMQLVLGHFRGRRSPDRRRHGYLKSLTRVMRSNFRAVRRYRPVPYQGGAHLIASRPSRPATDTGEGDRELLERLGRRLARRREKWGLLVEGGLTAHTIDGDHLDLFRPPTLELLAAKLREILDGAPARAVASPAAQARTEHGPAGKAGP